MWQKQNQTFRSKCIPAACPPSSHPSLSILLVLLGLLSSSRTAKYGTYKCLCARETSCRRGEREIQKTSDTASIGSVSDASFNSSSRTCVLHLLMSKLNVCGTFVLTTTCASLCANKKEDRERERETIGGRRDEREEDEETEEDEDEDGKKERQMEKRQ